MAENIFPICGSAAAEDRCRGAALDAASEADKKLTQLRSLLTSMYGVGAKGFEDIGSRHRDHLLWLASDLAEEIADLQEVAHG
jgi:hypothetical protein